MIILRYLHFSYMLFGIISTFLIYQSSSSINFFLYLFSYIYLVPPLFFQLVFRIGFPKYKGDLDQLAKRSFVGEDSFSIWWISSQMQVHFLRFPFLEEMIKWIPGAYSFWLRLWGAQVGKNVLWTPRVLIVDRPFLKVGDDVIIGTDARMTSHLANTLKDDRRCELFLDSIQIGNGATLGGGSNTYPGGRVKENQIIEAMGVVRNGIFFEKRSQP